ncbi:MAG: hypothetical protein EON60_04895 [Alphaproteobacteria bacterium]|nr:MAG: hypothetical protein EON60_04895 [Alphaproteobacteria bacterium]
MLMLKRMLGLFNRSQKDNDTTCMSPTLRAQRNLRAAVDKMTPLGRASESMTRGRPALEGKPMYMLNRNLLKLANQAGLQAHDPRQTNRLREPRRGDVLVVGNALMIVCGDYCAQHG